MPPIHSLSADFLPHHLWPFRQWYLGRSRYYHGPRTQPPPAVHSPRFYELVDPDLRELCQLVHSAGLRTTPSCQGHFHPRDRFQLVWNDLQHERSTITTTGLQVRDAETDKSYLFHDPYFILPWANFDSFHRQADIHQRTGYIGLLLSPHRPDLAQRLLNLNHRMRDLVMGFDAAAQRVFDFPLFHILVQAPDPHAQSRAWTIVTDRLYSALSPATSPSTP